jgi:hypothetical protein
MESINSWRFKGACYGFNVNFFFPHSQKASESKKFCTDCPVKSLCKTYAVSHDEYGIWGGTTRHERERYNPKFIEIIREMYYQAGLLEYRSSEPVREFLKRKQELQQEQQQVRIAAQQELKGPNLNLSLSEPA